MDESVDKIEGESEVGDKVMKDGTLANVEKDVIAAKYFIIEKSVCFLEIAVFVVEVLVLEHDGPEVKGTKAKEIHNLEYYKTFEAVKDVGQEHIGNHWVITHKEKHDGQKTDFKVRFVARGFQETEKPQLGSPMVAKEVSNY